MAMNGTESRDAAPDKGKISAVITGRRRVDEFEAHHYHQNARGSKAVRRARRRRVVSSRTA